MNKCEYFIKNKIFTVYLACRINLAKLGGLNFKSGFMFVCSFLSFFLYEYRDSVKFAKIS